MRRVNYQSQFMNCANQDSVAKKFNRHDQNIIICVEAHCHW